MLALNKSCTYDIGVASLFKIVDNYGSLHIPLSSLNTSVNIETLTLLALFAAVLVVVLAVVVAAAAASPA